MFPVNLQIELTNIPIDDDSGSYEINTPLGRVTIRDGEDRCCINNSLVTEDSVIFANLETVDQTARSAHVTEQTEGSFVIMLDQSATGHVRVGFLVVTP